MSDIEIKQLLKDFIQTPQNFTCPHGRPLFIHYDKHKLETLFLRKVIDNYLTHFHNDPHYGS